MDGVTRMRGDTEESPMRPQKIEVFTELLVLGPKHGQSFTRASPVTGAFQAEGTAGGEAW